MDDHAKLAAYSHEELRQELRTREATPPSPDGSPAAKVLGMKTARPLAEFDSKTLVAVLREKQKLVYGTDDRVEIKDAPPQGRADADSVVALFKAAGVVDMGNGKSQVRTKLFVTSYELCASEPFGQQPCGAYCSGFLVAPDVVATAGHCARPEEFAVADIRFIFGFRVDEDGNVPTVFPNSEIYRGVELIDYRYTAAGTDWALVRLDRPVPNHPVVAIRRDGRIPDHEALHVIGHPCGLPAKYADKAQVRTNANPAFFLANLDTYGGNSGSPVFNSHDHTVEGILVRGDNDFVSQGHCNVSNVCPAAGCSGESVVRTTEFAGLIPLA